MNTTNFFQTYGAYRERLNSFVKFPDISNPSQADEQGYSLPATYIRNRNTSNAFLKWSDSTIYLGWLLGALATEHYILSTNKLPEYSKLLNIQQNEFQIYCVLRAMNRLLNFNPAEAFPKSSGKLRTQGFFIRDDVPEGFFRHFAGITYQESDYSNPGKVTDKEMSQDQICHLLIGFSLVHTLIPPALQILGTNLIQCASQQALLIVEWASRNGWTIYNPIIDAPVTRGAEAFWMAAGLSRALKAITGGNVDLNDKVPPLSTAIWDEMLPLLGDFIATHTDNLHMTMAVASAGMGWGNKSLEILLGMSRLENWIIYPLLHAIIARKTSTPTAWHGNRGEILNQALGMLTYAPVGGPACPGNRLSRGWWSANRFIRSKSEANDGDRNWNGQEFNGIDYLLLFNLAAIEFFEL